MHALLRSAISARDVSAFEAAVEHCRIWRRRGCNGHDSLDQRRRRADAAGRSDVEIGQPTLEEPRDLAANGMRVEQDGKPMPLLEPTEFGTQRLVIWHPVCLAASRDLLLLRLLAGQPDRLLGEGRSRAKLGIVGARIESLAVGRAVQVDDVAGIRRTNRAGAKLSREAIKTIHM